MYDIFPVSYATTPKSRIRNRLIDPMDSAFDWTMPKNAIRLLTNINDGTIQNNFPRFTLCFVTIPIFFLCKNSERVPTVLKSLLTLINWINKFRHSIYSFLWYHLAPSLILSLCHLIKFWAIVPFNFTTLNLIFHGILFNFLSRVRSLVYQLTLFIFI